MLPQQYFLLTFYFAVKNQAIKSFLKQNYLDLRRQDGRVSVSFTVEQ